MIADDGGAALVDRHRYAPYRPGMACRGVPWGSFPFAPADDRRKSANSAVRCWGVAVSGWSRSTFVVDGGSSGGVDAKGDACVAPTQIGPYPPGMAYRGVPWGSFPFAPAHDRRKSANSAVRCWGGRGVGVVAVDNRGRRWFTWRC